jgi:hypothetical protein|nr:MAG TPA: hypothetical protein [Caudoviricetes sp.]
MIQVPGLNIDYSKDTFYYSFAFYSKNEEHLNKVVESFAEYYDNDIFEYDHETHKKNDIYYTYVILKFDRYMETFFDVENRMQEAGIIDVQFDYRIMTLEDFIIFESNLYSKYLSKKHYIAAVFKDNNLLDTDIVNFSGVKQYLIDYNIPQAIINKFDNADFFPDKNKVLDEYYDANNIDERLYFAASDNHYIELLLRV